MSTLMTPMLALIALTALLSLWALAAEFFTDSAQVDAEGAPRFIAVPPVSMRADTSYRQLLEQPTIFYAIVLYIVFRGHTDGLYDYLAWAYVVLRGLYALFQCLMDAAALRFPAFALSSLVLVFMALREISTFL